MHEFVHEIVPVFAEDEAEEEEGAGREEAGDGGASSEVEGGVKAGGGRKGSGEWFGYEPSLRKMFYNTLKTDLQWLEGKSTIVVIYISH